MNSLADMVLLHDGNSTDDEDAVLVSRQTRNLIEDEIFRSFVNVHDALLPEAEEFWKNLDVELEEMGRTINDRSTPPRISEKKWKQKKFKALVHRMSLLKARDANDPDYKKLRFHLDAADKLRKKIEKKYKKAAVGEARKSLQAKKGSAAKAVAKRLSENSSRKIRKGAHV